MPSSFAPRRRALCSGLAAASLLAAAPRTASAQPSQRRLVIPYPPGGSTDLLGRVFADALGTQLGDKLVVENRPGANGTVGAHHVATGASDGRTLLYTFGNLLLNQQFMMKDPKVNPLTDMAPVTRTCVIQAVVVAAADSPAKDLAEFIAMARRNPGKHSFAYYGDVSIMAIAGEAGLDLVRVPYKGGVPGMLDVAGGRVDVIYSSVAQAGPMLRSGKLKALAVSGDQRLAEWPNVPLVKEVLPKYRALDYQVVLAPKATPKSVIDELYAKSAVALSSDDVKRQFVEKGAMASPMRPDELRAFMEADYAAIGAVCKANGIVAE